MRIHMILGAAMAPLAAWAQVGPMPTITSFTPPDTFAANPLTLTVNGTGFLSSCSPDCLSLQLNWNGMLLSANANSVTDTSFSVDVPPSLLSTPNISYVYVYNGLSSSSKSFDVRPNIQGLSLNGVSAGSLAQTVSLYGHFTYLSNETVLWNNSPVSATPDPARNQINVSVPSSLLSTSGTANIVVMDSFSSTASASTTLLQSNPQPFSVRPPAITSLSPNHINAGPQTNVTVTGTDFVMNTANASQVYLGNNPMPTTFVSATQLSFMATPMLPGSLNVTVHNTPNAVSAPVSLAVVAPAPTGQFSVVDGPDPPPAPPNQYHVKFQLLSGYPLPLSVTITPTYNFDPSTFGSEADPTRTAIVPCAPCQIAVGSTDSPPVMVQAGTTAGTVHLTAALKLVDGTDVTPSPPPSYKVSIPPGPPGIDPSPGSGVQMEISGSSFNICVQGYSTTRDMVDVSFHFTGTRIAPSDMNKTPTPSGTLGNCPYDNQNGLFQCHFSPAGASTPARSGHFNYVQTFSVTGNVSDITGASVMMQNSQGSSGPFQAVVGACNQNP